MSNQLDITSLFKKEPNVLSVSELTDLIKGRLENEFTSIAVWGEVSNLRIPASGHAYFTLKDKESQIRTVMFKGNLRKIKFEIEDGLEIVCFGRVSVYKPRGEYQIIADLIEPKGLGALFLQFQKIKEKLEKAGYFDEKAKKPIPFLPIKIGIVSSKTGAAIKDMIRGITERFPNINIILYPAKVQGEGAAQEVASGIKYFNEQNEVDVIIIGRGGGSIEDLWAFNEEILADAIFKSEIPIISAVGHEIDYTISDFTADVRAPTPSFAANLVVPLKKDLLEKIKYLNKNLSYKIKKILSEKIIYFKNLRTRLKSPKKVIEDFKLKLDDLLNNIIFRLKNQITIKKSYLQTLIEKLSTLNPLAILSRGYSITKLNEKIVKSVKHVKIKDKISTTLKDGSIESTITNINKK